MSEADKVFSIIEIAAICHEVNRLYSKYIGEIVPSWIDSSAAHKESMISGVKYKLRVAPDATPKDQHTEWMKIKAADGWKYGKVKSESEKTHPCLVPYECLSVNQRRKDYLFQSLIKVLSQTEFEDLPLYTQESGQPSIPDLSPEMETYISTLAELLPDLYDEED